MKNLLFIAFFLFAIHFQTAAQNDNGGSSKKTTKKTNVNNNNKVNPQPTNKVDTDAYNAAADMCDCVNRVLSDIHPFLKKMMVTSVEKGEKAAEDELMQYLISASEEDRNRIQEDAQKLQNIESALDEQCQEFDAKYKAYENNAEFEQKVLDYLAKRSGCELTYFAFKSQQK